MKAYKKSPIFALTALLALTMFLVGCNSSGTIKVDVISSDMEKGAE